MKNILYSIFFVTTIMQSAASHLNEAELKATALYPVLQQLLPNKKSSKKTNPIYIVFAYLTNRNPSTQLTYFLNHLPLLEKKIRISLSTEAHQSRQIFCNTDYSDGYSAKIITQNPGSVKPDLMILHWSDGAMSRIMKLNHFGLYCPPSSHLVCRTVKLNPSQGTVSVGFELNNATCGYMQTFSLDTGEALTTFTGRPLVYSYTNRQAANHDSGNRRKRHTTHRTLHHSSHLAPSYVTASIHNKKNWTCGFYINPREKT